MDGWLGFPDLKDSPIFQGRVSELQHAHEASLAKTKLLVDAGRRYARALETAYQASHEFADAVESFGVDGGGLREDSGPAVAPKSSVPCLAWCKACGRSLRSWSCLERRWS